ncbi:hypothetical protein JOM56_015195 [Amanita muscaria]
MSASGSKSPSKSTTRGSSHKRKKSKEEADIQRKRPYTISRSQSVDRFTGDAEAGDEEAPSMNRGNGDAQSGGGVYLGFPIPTETPTVATETRSITLFQRASNFQISDTNITAIGGDATIIRFGDGQFTEVQRDLVREINTFLSKHNTIFVDL